MDAAGLSGPELAEATKEVDSDGRGVSASLIGFLSGSGSSARERCRLRSAWLISEALSAPLQSLFSMPSRSTSTEERSIPHGDQDPR